MEVNVEVWGPTLIGVCDKKFDCKFNRNEKNISMVIFIEFIGILVVFFIAI